MTAVRFQRTKLVSYFAGGSIFRGPHPPRAALMLIKIGFDIEFELAGPTPMILMLYVHPSRQRDLRSEEKILVEPNIPLTDFTDLYDNRCARILAPAGNLRLSLNALIEDSGQPDKRCPDAPQH